MFINKNLFNCKHLKLYYNHRRLTMRFHFYGSEMVTKISSCYEVVTVVWERDSLRNNKLPAFFKSQTKTKSSNTDSTYFSDANGGDETNFAYWAESTGFKETFPAPLSIIMSTDKTNSSKTNTTKTNTTDADTVTDPSITIVLTSWSNSSVSVYNTRGSSSSNSVNYSRWSFGTSTGYYTGWTYVAPLVVFDANYAEAETKTKAWWYGTNGYNTKSGDDLENKKIYLEKEKEILFWS